MSSKFIKYVGKRSNDRIGFRQAARQVADHGVLRDFQHSHGVMARVGNSTDYVRFKIVDQVLGGF